MGYDCGSTAVGDSLDELLASVQEHATKFHNLTWEKARSPEVIEVWKGAIKQASRPGEIRTPRPEFGRDVKPH
jgi:predicted small metal-binding protein